MKLAPWQSIRDRFLPLDAESYAALKASIARDGLLQPIDVLPDGRIIDGHHRYRVCKELGIEGRARVLELTEQQALDRAERVNVAHRQISPEQMAEIRERKRKRAVELRSEGWTQKDIAAELGVARETVRDWFSNGGSAKAKAPVDCRVVVPRERHPELVAQLDSGAKVAQVAADYGISEGRVSQIATQHRAAQKKPAATETPDLPVKRYRCIVIDPPWPMGKSERLERPKQGKHLDYPTMTVEQIEDLPVAEVADPEGCQVYLWTTHKFLPDAILRCFPAWGVNYHCTLTWVKPSGPTPFSWMFNTEFVVFGYIGAFDIRRKGLKVSFEAPHGQQHSEKPQLSYDRIVEASHAPRLEMFARDKRKGWDVWGDEV